MTGRRRALLLACGTFTDPGLAPLRSPAHDAEQLSRVLEGGDYTVTPVVDSTCHPVRLAIEDFFGTAHASDALNLLYFSCHGVLDSRGCLHFAFADTDRSRLRSTAVSAEWVRDCLRHSRSRATLVLVDCCFSGAFLHGMRARSAEPAFATLVHDPGPARGVAVITASGDHEYSFEDASPSAAKPSYFTEAVISGLAGRDGPVTVDDLYNHVRARLAEGPSGQHPLRLSAGEGALVVIETSTPPVEKPPEPPPVEELPEPPPDRRFALAATILGLTLAIGVTLALTSFRGDSRAVSRSTGTISSPVDGSDVLRCADFTGSSNLAPGETLILAMRNLTNHDPRRYVQFVTDWGEPTKLTSWHGRQYFSGANGQHYKVELMAVPLSAAEAARDNSTAMNALAVTTRSTTLDAVEVVRAAGTARC
ncbi:caspase family protein [Actinoplanes sp. NPDC049596]|uniref:caspase family protein n=1 Tax=unclassified Actinoplanes TaxID=2626549 RepID=UPI003416EA3B